MSKASATAGRSAARAGAAARKTLSAENLAALGADRLAALLMELSEGSAAVKRRLRLEVVGAASPADLTKEIRKRVATIARSRGIVDWQNRKALQDDLETQRRAIAEQVAKRNPAEALELMWEFLALGRPVSQRVHDGSGAIDAVFRAAVDDIGGIAQTIRPDATVLADRIFTCLSNDPYGHFESLLAGLKTVLGSAGLQRLKQRVVAWANQPVPRPADKDRQILGWAVGRGPLYADDAEARSRDMHVKHALRLIADAEGDADAFIAQYDEHARKAPHVAAEIAQRLLQAGRTDEAWRAIEAAETHRMTPFEFHNAKIAVLEALGRNDEAQAVRWSCFERALSSTYLRDYLKKLPDFEDFDAEQRALDHVAGYSSAVHGVAFLVQWPALDRAARMVMQRAAELDGNAYEILTPAAEALAGRYPLAATLCLRAMIGFSLQQARFSRYSHAARHLRDCAGLAASIADWGNVETHDQYVARLKREHGRKAGFWSAVG